MKVLKFIAATGFISFFISCSSMRVEYDYDPKVDLSQIRTYGWLQKPQQFPNNAQDALTKNSLLDKRMKKAVNVQLISMGLQIENDNPDVLVTYYTGLRDKVDFQPVAAIPIHRRRGPRISGGLAADNYTEGTFIVDVMDAESKEILWRGITYARLDENLTPKELEEALDKAVKKMFAKLPDYLAS